MASFKEVTQLAEEASDPILAMLKRADECLNRMEPDITGALVNLHGARLALACRLMSPDHG